MDEQEPGAQQIPELSTAPGAARMPIAAGAAARMVEMIIARLHSPHAGIGARSFSGGSLWQQVTQRLGYGTGYPMIHGTGITSPVSLQRTVDTASHIDLVWRLKKQAQAAEQYDDWGPRQPIWYSRPAPAPRPDVPGNPPGAQTENASEHSSVPETFEQQVVEAAPIQEGILPQANLPGEIEPSTEAPAFALPAVVRIGYVPEPMVVPAQPLVSIPALTAASRTHETTPLVAPSLGEVAIARQAIDRQAGEIVPTTDLLHRIAERREQNIPDLISAPSHNTGPKTAVAPGALEQSLPAQLSMPLVEPAQVARQTSPAPETTQPPKADQGLLARLVERVASALPFRQASSPTSQAANQSVEAGPVPVQPLATPASASASDHPGLRNAQGAVARQPSGQQAVGVTTGDVPVEAATPLGLLASLRQRFTLDRSQAERAEPQPSALPMPLATAGRSEGPRDTPAEELVERQASRMASSPSAPQLASPPPAVSRFEVGVAEQQLSHIIQPEATVAHAIAPLANRTLDIEGKADMPSPVSVDGGFVSAHGASAQEYSPSEMPPGEGRVLPGANIGEGPAADVVAGHARPPGTSPTPAIEPDRPAQNLVAALLSRLLGRAEPVARTENTRLGQLEMTLAERRVSLQEELSAFPNLSGDDTASSSRQLVPTIASQGPLLEAGSANAANPLVTDPFTVSVPAEDAASSPVMRTSAASIQPDAIDPVITGQTIAPGPVDGTQSEATSVANLVTTPVLVGKREGAVRADDQATTGPTHLAVQEQVAGQSAEPVGPARFAPPSSGSARQGIFAELIARLLGSAPTVGSPAGLDAPAPRLSLPWTRRTPPLDQSPPVGEPWDRPAAIAPHVAPQVASFVGLDMGVESAQPGSATDTETPTLVAEAAAQQLEQAPAPLSEPAAVPAPAGRSDFADKDALLLDALAQLPSESDAPAGAADSAQASRSLTPEVATPEARVEADVSAEAWTMLETLAMEVVSSHSPVGAIGFAEAAQPLILERFFSQIEAAGLPAASDRTSEAFARAGLALRQSRNRLGQSTGNPTDDLLGLGLLTGTAQRPLFPTATTRSSQHAVPSANAAISDYGSVGSQADSGRLLARTLGMTPRIADLAAGQDTRRANARYPEAGGPIAEQRTDAGEGDGDRWMAVLRRLYGDNRPARMPLAYAGQALPWPEGSSGAESFDVSRLVARHSSQQIAASMSPATYPGPLDTYNSAVEQYSASFGQADDGPGWIGGSADMTNSEAGAWADVVSSAVGGVSHGVSPSLALAGEERTPTGGQSGSQEQQAQMEEADNPNPDVDDLAQSVYAIIRRRLAIERERSRT